MQATADGTCVLDLLATSGIGDIDANPLNPTLSDGSVQVGAPAGPDLIVADISITWDSDTQYDVTYTITNVGADPAGAFDTTLDIDSTVVDTHNHTGLAAGASDVVSFNDVTLSGATDDITVITDSGDAVAETNETNNTGTATADPGTDDAAIFVHKNLKAEITITITTDDVNGDLEVGENCMGATEGAFFNVQTNGRYTVTATNDGDGFMDEYDVISAPPVLVPAGRSLIWPLHVYQTDDCVAALAGTPEGGSLETPQLLVTDDGCTGQEGGAGEDYPVRFTQDVELGDDVLPAGFQYGMTVTFTAMYTGPCS
jgi:hypothetical protein